MFSRTQYLITEIGEGCNLTASHGKCPSADPRRWRAATERGHRKRLDDDTLVACVVAAYRQFGFTGLWGTHYYCEPLLYAERLVHLAQRIRAKVPELRMCLWTNGLLPADVRDAGRFEKLYWTQYCNQLPLFQAHYDKLVTLTGKFDGRLEQRIAEGDRSCARIWTEFILDARGQHHPCCYDWQGNGSLGNVFDAGGFAELVRKWDQCQCAVGGRHMTDYAPASCLSCGFRTAGMTRFDEAAAKRAEEWRLSQC